MSVSLEQVRADREFEVIRLTTRAALFGIAPGLLVLNALIAASQTSASTWALALFGLNWLQLAVAMAVGYRVFSRERMGLSYGVTAAGVLVYVFGVLVLRQDADVACSFGAMAIVVLGHLVGGKAFTRTVGGAAAAMVLGILIGWASPWNRLVCPTWIKSLEAIGVSAAIFLLMWVALRQRTAHGEEDLAAVRRAGERQALWAQAGEKSAGLLLREVEGLRSTIETLGKQAAGQEGLVARATAGLQEMAATAGANAEASRRLVEVAEGSRGGLQHATDSFARLAHEAEEAARTVEESRKLAVGVAAAAVQLDSVLTFLQRLLAELRVLSINARLEAARAGEQGKGFAVVVSELMRLLEDVKANFEQSKQLLGGVKADAGRSGELSQRGAEAVGRQVSAANAAGAVLGAMATSLAEMSTLASPIGVAAREQQANVGDLALAAERQRELAGEIQGSVVRLRELADRLRQAREELEDTAQKASA